MADDPTIEQAPQTRNLIGVVCAMLESFGYSYHELDPSTIQLAIGNPHGVYQIYFTATDETDFVRVICHYGSRVPIDRRPAAIEALTRINWRAGVGSFDMDMSDGDIRYRIGMDVEGGLLSEKMADNMLGIAMHMMEKYHEPLMRIAFGDADPEIAIEEVP